MANGAAFAEDPRICQPGGGGLFLPLGGEAELHWHPKLRVFLYGTGLVYCFIGISIVADMFMAAIEKITSKQHKVRIPGSNRYMTVQVWNDTVANLTLMALGSSAPEILLSLNEVFKNKFFEGKLGPSTIIGSAAFNLFVIIAVCINSIPNSEVRFIKGTKVFAVTAVFSILAYVWLLYIVQFNSRDVIEVWEGISTFLGFPLMVSLSYATDIGCLQKDSLLAAAYWVIRPRLADDSKEQDSEEEENEWTPWVCLMGWLSVVRSLCLRTCRWLQRCVRRRLRSETSDQSDLQISEERFDLDGPILDEKNELIDFEAGIMTFSSETVFVDGGLDEREITVVVYRKNGTRGRVHVEYSTVSLTAVPGFDYVETEGELLFRDGMTQAEITLTILPKEIGEKNDKFQLVIEDQSGVLMFNPYHDGGEERNILTVHIINENPGVETWRGKAWAVVDGFVNMDEIRLGNQTYKEQIIDSFWVNGSREAQDTAGFSSWTLHLIWAPFQIPLNLLTPPPVYLGGWVCFFMSLLGIGLLTIIVGDLAELFGCAMGIDDSITAITVVAMGTSVPDLFASRAAAKQDEYADASIVNVTGSNSVNVFLGIGLPWMCAAIYWRIRGQNEEWTSKYFAEYGAEWGKNGEAVFVVRSGQVFFSVMVFTVAACICLTVIEIRRYVFGGELGGDSDPKAYSSFLLILLWFFYISLSIWKLITMTDDARTQIIAVVIALHVVVVLMILFAFTLQALKFSKRFIGEEGFWGIFVAAGVIIGRIVFFLMFQFEW